MNAPEALPAAPEVAALALASIVPSKTNPRKRFDKLGMEELTASVARHGVIQPVLVRPRAGGSYELVSGERRYRAAKSAQLAAIPALIRPLSDAEALELQVIENLQREDLHELEEAEGYEQLLKCIDAATGKPYDVDTIAAKVGKSRAYVYARLKLTALDAKAREAFFAGKLNASTALLLARIPTRPLQLEALGDITNKRYGDEPMSFREAARHIHEKFMLRLAEAPFAPADGKLLPAAGPCTACPKRTGNQPELFADIKSGDVCTDPSCFAEKKALHFKHAREDALAGGRTVIAGKQAKHILSSEHSDYIDDRSGFVKPGDRCYDDAKQRTYAQILGKDAPAPTLVEHPASGALIEVLPLSEIMQTLKGKGVTKEPRARQASSGERAAVAKAKLELKIRAAIFEAVHAAYDGQMSTADGALIAAEFFECTSHDFRKRVVELWSPAAAPTEGKPEKEKKGLRSEDDWKRQKAFKKRIPTLGAAELARLLLDLALVGEVSNAHSYGAGKGANLVAAAARLGVDAAKIRRELTAAAKPATKPKTKKPASGKKRAAKHSATAAA